MEGHTIYQGRSDESVSYFKTLGFECPQYTNPSDYFLKEFSLPKSGDVNAAAYKDKLDTLVSAYHDTLSPKVEDEDSRIKLVDITGSVLQDSHRSAGWCTEYGYLVKRTFMNQLRSPLYLRARIFQTIFMSLLILSLFWNLGFDLEGIQGKTGMIFFICTNQVFMSLFGVLMAFLNERDIFLREYCNKTYGVLAYYLAKVSVELPFLAIMPVFFSAIIYFGVGLTESADRFWIFCLVLVLLVYCASSLGFFIGTAFENESVAIAVAPLVVSPIIIFSGVFFDLSSAYVWLRWLQWVSPIRY